MPLWIASRRPARARRAPLRSSASASGVDVEVVGEVALGVEVHRQDVQADPAEHVVEGADHGRLARAALLGQDGDRGGTRAGSSSIARARPRATETTPFAGLSAATRHPRPQFEQASPASGVIMARPNPARRAPTRRRRGTREVNACPTSARAPPKRFSPTAGRYRPTQAYRAPSRRSRTRRCAHLRRGAQGRQADHDVIENGLRRAPEDAPPRRQRGRRGGRLRRHDGHPAHDLGRGGRQGGHAPDWRSTERFAVAHVFVSRRGDRDARSARGPSR